MYPVPLDVRRVAYRFARRVQRDEIALVHVCYLLTHTTCEEMDPNVEESLHQWCHTLNVSIGYLCQAILDESGKLIRRQNTVT